MIIFIKWNFIHKFNFSSKKPWKTPISWTLVQFNKIQKYIILCTFHFSPISKKYSDRCMIKRIALLFWMYIFVKRICIKMSYFYRMKEYSSFHFKTSIFLLKMDILNLPAFIEIIFLFSYWLIIQSNRIKPMKNMHNVQKAFQI